MRVHKTASKHLVRLVLAVTLAALGPTACGAAQIEDPSQAPAQEDSTSQPIAEKRQALIGEICAVAQWGYVMISERSNPRDKYKHCLGSCSASRYCGLEGSIASGSIWIVKESIDWACSYGPGWLKDLLKTVGFSACGGWDWEDIQANSEGAKCSLETWNSCSACCDRKF